MRPRTPTCAWNWRGCCRCELLAAQPGLEALKSALKVINARMWDIQDQLRDKEAAQDFDAVFIQLARGVYGTNGERVKVKNEINRIAGSQLVEEKQYQGE